MYCLSSQNIAGKRQDISVGGRGFRGKGEGGGGVFEDSGGKERPKKARQKIILDTLHDSQLIFPTILQDSDMIKKIASRNRISREHHIKI